MVRKVVYECQELKHFSSAKSYYTSHCKEYCSKVVECIKSQLSWSDMHQLRVIVFVLASQGWQNAVEEKDSVESVDTLVQQFSIPLQSAGADIGTIHREFQELLQYATTYESLSTLKYQVEKTRRPNQSTRSSTQRSVRQSHQILGLIQQCLNLMTRMTGLPVIRTYHDYLVVSDMSVTVNISHITLCYVIV